MDNVYLLIIILLLVAGINVLITLLIKKHPEKISGFKLGNTPEERKNGCIWIGLLSKVLHVANIVTIIGAVISIVLDNLWAYALSLSLPVIVAVIYAYTKLKDTNRTDTENSNRKNITLACIICFCLTCGCIAIAYPCNSDLNLTFDKTGINIEGMYGETIPYKEIKTASIVYELPPLKYRSNGFSAGETKLGNFITKADEHIMLFTHSKGLYIRLTTTSGKSFYMNNKQAEQTTKNYEAIKHKLKKQGNVEKQGSVEKTR